MSWFLLPFGKYRNVDLQNIPTPYLTWAVGNMPMEPDLVGAITRELLDRNMREIAQLFQDCPTAIDRMRDVLQDLFCALDRYGFESPSLSQLKTLMEVE